MLMPFRSAATRTFLLCLFTPTRGLYFIFRIKGHTERARIVFMAKDEGQAQGKIERRLARRGGSKGSKVEVSTKISVQARNVSECLPAGTLSSTEEEILTKGECKVCLRNGWKSENNCLLLPCGAAKEEDWCAREVDERVKVIVSSCDRSWASEVEEDESACEMNGRAVSPRVKNVNNKGWAWEKRTCSIFQPVECDDKKALAVFVRSIFSWTTEMTRVPTQHLLPWPRYYASLFFQSVYFLISLRLFHIRLPYILHTHKKSR